MNAIVILAPGFETIEALTPIDVLRRLGIQTVIAGLGGLTITSAQRVTVTADEILRDQMPLPEVIVIPGGMPGAVNIGANATAKKLVTAQHARGGLIAAICAAPVKTLGAWNLLNGKRATCYPDFIDEFPATGQYTAADVVVDDNLITSRGAGTALEFAFAIGKKLCGEKVIAELKARMMYNHS